MKILENKTILLVEDDAFISRMYERVLIKRGARVIKASNGAEGLEKLRTENVDLITVDLMMPKMNGYEALKTIKADPKAKDIPTIILTNIHEHREDVEKVRQLGVQGYFVNLETSMEKYLNKVNQYINHKSPRGNSE